MTVIDGMSYSCASEPSIVYDCVQPEFHGMIPVEGGMLSSCQRTAVRWPVRLKQAAALCHSLNLVTKHQVAGDLADQQAFQAVEAQFLVMSALLICHVA